MYSELYATGLFEEMSASTDEDEHSIEMQLPYIAKVMERFVTKYIYRQPCIALFSWQKVDEEALICRSFAMLII